MDRPWKRHHIKLEGGKSLWFSGPAEGSWEPSVSDGGPLDGIQVDLPHGTIHHLDIEIHEIQGSPSNQNRTVRYEHRPPVTKLAPRSSRRCGVISHRRADKTHL